MIRELQNEIEQIFEILQTPSEGMRWFSPWTKKQIEEEIERSWNRGFFEGEKLVGFLFAREHDEGLEITNLGTRVENRKQGIMQKLFDELIRMRPYKKLWLEVHEGNLPAIKLYESFGFKEVGRRKRYYNDGSSAIAMTRTAE